MKFGLTIICSSILLFCSCKKEKTEFHTASFEEVVITGYFLRDYNAAPAGVVGAPNVKISSDSNFIISDYYMLAYPNYFKDIIHLHVKSLQPSELKRIWITRAYWKESPYSNSTLLGVQNFLSVGSPALIELESTDNNFSFNLEKFGKGYYRIYVSMGGNIYYDNIVNN